MVLCNGAVVGCSRPSRDGCDSERLPPPSCCSVVESGNNANSSNTGEMSALLHSVAAECVPPLLCVNSACDDGAGVMMQATSEDCHPTRDITVVVGDSCSLRDKDFADYSVVAQFSDDSTTDSCIPCVIASEMIVTTSRPPRMSKRPRKTRPCKISCEVVSDHAVGVTMNIDSNSCVRATTADAALAATVLERVEQVGSDVENCNTCYLSSTSTDVIEQRLCDLARSRSRMRLKRADPEYRELERQRDRERRRCARQTNLLQRQAEKARDREYRRRRRQEQQQQLKPCAAATMADVCQRNYFDVAYEQCVDGSARTSASVIACDTSSAGSSL